MKCYRYLISQVTLSCNLVHTWGWSASENFTNFYQSHVSRRCLIRPDTHLTAWDCNWFCPLPIAIRADHVSAFNFIRFRVYRHEDDQLVQLGWSAWAECSDGREDDQPNWSWLKLISFNRPFIFDRLDISPRQTTMNSVDCNCIILLHSAYDFFSI